MQGITTCAHCGNLLRAVTLFCPGCRQAYCSWACLLAHQQVARGALRLSHPGTCPRLPRAGASGADR